MIAEHVGHLVVTANIVKRDLIRDPGLHRSMFANGFSTIISGFFGSTPNTTYGENIGVMAITRVYSTWVIGGAAIIAILLSCVGKLAAIVGVGLSLIFKLISVIRPEEVVLDADESEKASQ